MKKRLAKKIFRNHRYYDPPIVYPTKKFMRAYYIMEKKNPNYFKETLRIARSKMPESFLKD